MANPPRKPSSDLDSACVFTSISHIYFDDTDRYDPAFCQFSGFAEIPELLAWRKIEAQKLI